MLISVEELAEFAKLKSVYSQKTEAKLPRFFMCGNPGSQSIFYVWEPGSSQSGLV